MKKLFLITLAALTVAMSGCNDVDGLKDDVRDLKKRVSTLEGTLDALGTQVGSGSLISSVTELPDGSGYRIGFTGGISRADDYVDILHGNHGNHGVSPQIEVRTNPNGSSTIWYKTDGDWTSTGVNITGKGDTGSTGGRGVQGIAGVTPIFKVDENEDEILSIFYNIAYDAETDTYDDDEWQDLGIDFATTGPILFLEDNGNFVTFHMNDADDTEYTFAKASGAVQIHIMTVGKAEVEQSNVREIKFRVNPSDAFVPTGFDTDIANWSLDCVDTYATRVGYVNEDPEFELVGIMPSVAGAGEYIACIGVLFPDLYNYDYALALVLDTGRLDSDDKPALVSSAPFLMGLADAPDQPYVPIMSISLGGPLNLAIPGPTGSFTVAITPANATDTQLEWTSDDPSVAGVDINTGEVTPVGLGTTTIRAQATDGTGFQGAGTVNVIQLVTGIALSESTLSLEIGAVHPSLVATVTPADASDGTVVWSSSAPTIVNVNPDTGEMKAVGIGDADICATAIDGSGTTSNACAVTVTAPTFPKGAPDSNYFGNYGKGNTHNVKIAPGGNSFTFEIVDLMSFSMENLIWEATNELALGGGADGYAIRGTVVAAGPITSSIYPKITENKEMTVYVFDKGAGSLLVKIPDMDNAEITVIIK